MAGDHDARAAWQRYAPWEGTYRAGLQRSALRMRGRSVARRVGIWLVAAFVVVVALAFAVRVVLAIARWELWSLLDALVTPVNAFVPLGLAWWRWPPETRIQPGGLAVRSEPWRTRSVAWSDVEEVRRPGRFDEHPVAVLSGGERLELLGLPAGVAEAMAAATRVEPDSPPRQRPGPRRPEPGEDLDGPFHRGPARR